MMLIDTSAWIEFFRKNGDLVIKNKVKDLLLAGQAAYTCPVRYELFLGALPHEKEDLATGLAMSERIELSSKAWDTAAELAGKLRQKGLSFPALDLLIATVAEQEKMPLLNCDAHFSRIRDHVLPKLILVSG